MARGYRQGRLGEEIRRIISEMLIRDIKDPRLSAMISITETAEEQQKETIAALNRAKGFIRSEISHQIKMRHVPELIFKIDKSMEYGRHISNIIDQLEIDHSNDDEGEDR